MGNPGKLMAVAAAALGISFMAGGAALAEANPGNNGNAANAPGQERAEENCGEAINGQEKKGVLAGDGPKAGTGEPPINCDHFFQD